MSLSKREASHFFHTYKRLPLEIERGEGVYLYARDGKRYLDFFGGLAVNALGYAHPQLLSAIQEQARKYIHLSNYFLQEPQIKLAEAITKASGYPKVFFSNSGTEAIEGALKLTRKWGAKRKKTDVISFTQSFHGRTMGALSLMDRVKYREGYEPFLSNCCVIPFNNPDALFKAVNERTAGVFLEFIQGEGGVVPVSKEMAEALRVAKEQFDFVLVADEIQSGLGRTGKLFGFEHYDIQPDVVVFAKPIGGGLPLGGFLGNEQVSEVLEPGTHGTTFGGNPVACAAGFVVLDELLHHGVMNNAAAQGAQLKEGLQELQRQFPSIVKDVRGYGLMLGMELSRECGSVVTMLRDRGLLVNCTNINVLRFLPPLIIESEHIKLGLATLRDVLQDVQ